MKKFLVFFFLFSGFLAVHQLAAQASACPDVFATPDTSLCGTSGCVNLNATVQGTRATNTYNGYAVTYNPYPFTGGNSILLNIDDTWSGVIQMPFCFDFFGQTYNQIVIGSNAIVTFDITQAGGYCQWPIGNAIPSNANPMNSIMAPFHDIDPSVPTPTSATDINWQVYGAAPCREFVINWNDVAMFSCNAMIATSQLVLHESTNIIDIYIKDKPTCSAWNAGAAIEGIQDATGSTAFVAPGRNYPTQWNATNDGFRFEPAGAPNFTFGWFDMSGTPLSTATTYQVCPTTTTSYVAVVSNTSCSGTITVADTVTIAISPGTVTAQSSSTPDVCSSGVGSATATGSGGTAPYTYLWAPGGQTTPSVTGLSAGTYTVIITDASGCGVTTTVVVQNSSPPLSPVVTTNAVNGQLTQAGPGAPVQICFNNPSPGSVSSWNWLFDGTQPSTLQNPCFTVTDSGLYCITLAVQDTQGCTGTAQSCVSVVSEATITFPNVFTPNGDNNNDFFFATSVGVKSLTLEIFDRWGVLVESLNISGGSVTDQHSWWNGKNSGGKEASDGVYYWVAKIYDFQDKAAEQTGFVHLIRGK